MGHTHRAGIVSESTGYGSKLQTVAGVEVGHLMNVAKVGYLKSGWANWMCGFCTITTAGKLVVPQLVPMAQDGSFVYEGRLWR